MLVGLFHSEICAQCPSVTDMTLYGVLLCGAQDVPRGNDQGSGNIHSIWTRRLFPVPQKEDPDTVNNMMINVGNLSDFEITTRIAFALAKGAIEAEPVARRVPPQDASAEHREDLLCWMNS